MGGQMAFSGFQRKGGIGAVKRARDQAEAHEARAFEDVLRLHKLDFWHPTISQRSQPGWPDYAIFGQCWLAFVELKARSRLTGRMGKMSAGQYRYKDSIESAGAEWRLFSLPDDWDDVHAWLSGHTGIVTREKEP